MLKVNCLADYLSALEEIPVSEIQKWLPKPEDPTILENKIGNRMLYPQVLSASFEDLIFDYALIRKIIEVDQLKFYNKNLKRIDIPEEFIHCFPDIQRLVAIFIDIILPSGITSFWIKSLTLGRKNLGTLIRPENLEAGSTITIGVGGCQYLVKAGNLALIPVSQSKADMTFTSATATLLGKKIISIEVVAGQLGLMVDARMI